MLVRIGLSMAPREIEIDIEDGAGLADDIEQALAADQAMVWATDRQGMKHGLVVDKIAFIEFESEESKLGIGFSTT